MHAVPCRRLSNSALGLPEFEKIALKGEPVEGAVELFAVLQQEILNVGECFCACGTRVPDVLSDRVPVVAETFIPYGGVEIVGEDDAVRRQSPHPHQGPHPVDKGGNVDGVSEFALRDREGDTAVVDAESEVILKIPGILLLAHRVIVALGREVMTPVGGCTREESPRGALAVLAPQVTKHMDDGGVRPRL